MDISTQVILQDVFEKQMQEINKKYKEASDKQGELVVDFTKKSTELQKVVDTAFNKFKLNPADKWQFDVENCIFHKGA